MKLTVTLTSVTKLVFVVIDAPNDYILYLLSF